MSLRSQLSRAVFLLVTLSLLTARTLSAGQGAETWTFLTPVVVGNCQSFQGPTAQEAATIGLVGGVSQPGEARHSSVQTTREIYIKGFDGDAVAAMKQLEVAIQSRRPN